MSPIPNSQEKSILLTISEKLMEAQRELDELALQLALGKAEGSDKFEEIKKAFHARIEEIKKVLLTVPSEDTDQLKAIMRKLETLLCTGRASTKEAFESQKAKLLRAINKVEEILIAKFHHLADVPLFKHDIETFKLKLQLLRLKFALKKFIVQDSFRTAMNDARKAARNIVDSAETKLEKAKVRYHDFSSEVQLAYDHMKRAVRNK